MKVVERRIKNFLLMKQETPNQRLRLIRELLQVNQTEFSKALGFKQSHISAVESEKKEVSVKIIYALVNKFKVSANWLLSGEGDMFLTHHDRVEYSDQESGENLATGQGTAPSGEFKFYISELELSSRITDLETAILQENILPLYNLCELFTQLQKMPLDLSILQKHLVPKSVNLPNKNITFNFLEAGNLKVFENKVLYFLELEKLAGLWRTEFQTYFYKLFSYLTHPADFSEELKPAREGLEPETLE